MDFYGFSNGVEQANALNFGSALANNSYNSINTGLLGSYDTKKVKKDQVGIDTDITNVNTANNQTLTDEITQGGGTAVGIGGVAAVGKGLRDAGNQLGKAKRIAEQHLKLATASGDSSEISKAQSLVDVTDKGDLKGFVRLTGKFANQRSVSKALGSNIDRAVSLATDINSGSSYGPAAASVSTSAGRTANSQIVARASEIENENRPAPAEEPVEAPTELDNDGLPMTASKLRIRAARLAKRAQFIQDGEGVAQPAVLGTAGRPSTLRQVNVAERVENPDGVIDERDLGRGGEFADEVFNDPSEQVVSNTVSADVDIARDTSDLVPLSTTRVGTTGVISNLGLGTGGDMLTGTETIGQRGIAATFRKGIASAFNLNRGVLDLSNVQGGLEDVDENGATLGRLGAGWANGIAERGLGGRDFSGAPAPRVAEAPAPVEEAPRVVEAPVAEAPAPRVAEAVESSVPKSSGTSTAANLIGSSEHADAIAGGGVDEVGIKAVSSLGGFSGAVGGAALKTVSTIGKAAKVLGPIANAGFLIDQSYEEGKSFFGKTHSLEGVGGWEKTGNLLKEGGDIAATIGSGLALAGPVTFGVSDIAALGVELGGGAMALAGDLMDDYGKYEQDKKAQSTTTTQLATDKAKQASDAQASNVAVQSASAAGNRNLSGRGSIAQVSQSAVRNY